jgi:hypothetical protein
MGRACSTNGEKLNPYRILVGKSEGKRPLRRPRHRWVDNIKRNLGEIGWASMDLIDLPRTGTSGGLSLSEHSNEPSGSITFWKILE